MTRRTRHPHPIKVSKWTLLIRCQSAKELRFIKRHIAELRIRWKNHLDWIQYAKKGLSHNDQSPG